MAAVGVEIERDERWMLVLVDDVLWNMWLPVPRPASAEGQASRATPVQHVARTRRDIRSSIAWQ